MGKQPFKNLSIVTKCKKNNKKINRTLELTTTQHNVSGMLIVLLKCYI